MPNVNAPFNAKNGLSTANVLVIDPNQNLSNIQTANIVTLNVTNPIAQFANNGVYVNGILVANNPNINFVAANTSNLSITSTSNTNPGNVTITLDTRNPPGTGGGGGGQPPGAPNLSIQVNVAGTFTGTANLLMDTVGNNMYLEGNVQLANASTLNFGGNQSNIANASIALTWNTSANSLDFIWG